MRNINSLPYIIHNDCMLFDVRYMKYNTEPKYPEHFEVIYRDLVTKEKYLEIWENPLIPIYFTKPEFRNYQYNKYGESLDKLYKVLVKPSEVLKTIALDKGDSAVKFYNDCIRNKNFQLANELFRYQYSYFADFPPDFYYRIWWKLNTINRYTPYTHNAFSDIEVDTLDSEFSSVDQVVKYAECPINIITLIDEITKDSHSFCLIPTGRDDKFHKQQQKDYFNLIDHLDEFKKELTDEFKIYGDFKFHFHWYNEEDELKMIIDYFKLINKIKFDFVVFWNMSFDIPYMLNRIKVLGGYPEDIVCHNDFPVKKYFYKYDSNNFVPQLKKDFFSCNSYTQYYCQMLLYAKIRKAQIKRGYSLNAIASDELGDKKLSYSDEGYTIENLAYLNYKKFIKYNIKDVILQLGINATTDDLNYFWLTSDMNLTCLEKMFSNTTFVRHYTAFTFAQQEKDFII